MKEFLLGVLIISLTILNTGCLVQNTQTDLVSSYDTTSKESKEKAEENDSIDNENNEYLSNNLEEETSETEDNTMYINVGDIKLKAKLLENSSTEALIEMLKKEPVTIDMRDFGNMEKVGSLPNNLPRNDKQITTDFGDLILYQGSSFVIYYESNSWNFTKLGKIENITKSELLKVLGDGDVTVTLSLK